LVYEKKVKRVNAKSMTTGGKRVNLNRRKTSFQKKAKENGKKKKATAGLQVVSLRRIAKTHFGPTQNPLKESIRGESQPPTKTKKNTGKGSRIKDTGEKSVEQKKPTGWSPYLTV